MENSGYNLRQRQFLVSTTAESLATIATSSVSILSPTMSYQSTSSSSSSTGGLTSAPTVIAAPTMASLHQETWALIVHEE